MLGETPFYGCATAEKMSAPFVLRVTGRSGHGSMPGIADNALVKAARYIEALADYEPEPTLIPEARALLETVLGDVPPVEEVLERARAVHPLAPRARAAAARAHALPDHDRRLAQAERDTRSVRGDGRLPPPSRTDAGRRRGDRARRARRGRVRARVPRVRRWDAVGTRHRALGRARGVHDDDRAGSSARTVGVSRVHGQPFPARGVRHHRLRLLSDQGDGHRARDEARPLRERAESRSAISSWGRRCCAPRRSPCWRHERDRRRPRRLRYHRRPRPAEHAPCALRPHRAGHSRDTGHRRRPQSALQRGDRRSRDRGDHGGQEGQARREGPARVPVPPELHRGRRGGRPGLRQAAGVAERRRHADLLPRHAPHDVQGGRRGARGRGPRRRPCEARRREALRHRSRVRTRAEPTPHCDLPGGAPLPDRPLSGQGAGPGHHVPPLRERAVRAALEPRARRVDPDHHGRGVRRRGSGQLLRSGRRGAGRRAEPPAASPRARRNGAPLRRRGRDPATTRRCLPSDACGGSLPRRARSVPGLPGDRGGAAELGHRDVRRSTPRDRELAVGRRPDPRARGESAGADGHGGRRPLAARAAAPLGAAPARLSRHRRHRAPHRAAARCVDLPPREDAGKEVSQPVSLDLDFARELGAAPGPYERLLTDALHGDSTRFPRWEVIEETWRIVQPILDAPTPIETYDRATWGPPAADAIAEGHGGWREPPASYS